MVDLSRALEKKIEDMTREVVKERHPDSVTGLIFAANQDLPRKETRNLERESSKLKEKLQILEENYEISLRNIRLEHESVVKEMKERIVDLTEQLCKAENPSKVALSDSVSSEITKIREFYAKKIEQMHLRHEKQLQALKRYEAFSL